MAQENKLQLIDVNKFKILSYFKKGNENQKRFHREKKKNMQVKVSRNLFKKMLLNEKAEVTILKTKMKMHQKKGKRQEIFEKKAQHTLVFLGEIILEKHPEIANY